MSTIQNTARQFEPEETHERMQEIMEEIFDGETLKNSFIEHTPKKLDRSGREKLPEISESL
jgi:hypothetical protein